MLLELAVGVLFGIVGLLPLHYNSLIGWIGAGFNEGVFAVTASFSVIFFQATFFMKNHADALLKSLFYAFVFSLALTPLNFMAAPFVKSLIQPVYFQALLFLVVFLLVVQSNYWFALFFACSGLLGTIAFQRLSLHNPLFLLFTGLFALPFLFSNNESEKTLVFSEKSVFLAALLSCFSSLFPGMTPALLAAVTALFFHENFHSAVWAVVVSKNYFDLIAVYSIHATRSLAAVMLSQSDASVWIALFASIAAFGLSFVFYSLLAPRLSFSFDALKPVIFVALLGLAVFQDGFLGLVVVAVAFAWALASAESRASASCLTGALIVPSLFFFSQGLL